MLLTTTNINNNLIKQNFQIYYNREWIGKPNEQQHGEKIKTKPLSVNKKKYKAERKRILKMSKYIRVGLEFHFSSFMVILDRIERVRVDFEISVPPFPPPLNLLLLP